MSDINTPKSSFETDTKTIGKERAARLKYVRKKLLKLTQAEFCEEGEIPMPSYAAWEKIQHSGLTEKGAKKCIIRYTQLGIICTEQWLLHGVGAPPSFESNSEHTITQQDALSDIAEELLAFMNHGNSIDYFFEDDRMAPIFKKGDTVAGFIKDKATINGQVCILLYEQKGQQIKTVGNAFPSTDNIIIHYENANLCPPLVIKSKDIKAIAPLLWFRRPDLS